jgi:hypothetical protein
MEFGYIMYQSLVYFQPYGIAISTALETSQHLRF